MTLQDAVDLQFYEDPAARIRRANKYQTARTHRYIWYRFIEGRLRVQQYKWTQGNIVLITKLASFRLSPNTDWILT